MTQCETTVHENPLLPESSGPPPRAPTTPIARRRFGTVSALVLALGATLPTDKPESHSLPSDPSSHQTLSVPQKIHSGIPEEVTVEDFRIQDATFTCRFGNRDIKGSLDENGAISTVQFDNVTITLTSPVSPQTLERFLRNATGTAALLTARGIASDGNSLTTIGGARFLFSQRSGGTLTPSIATRHDILQIDTAAEEKRLLTEEEWRAALRTTTEISATQKREIDQRMAVHNDRMHLVYDDLTQRIHHSYNSYYWHEQRNEFVHGWNALVSRWDDASANERGELLSSFQEHLRSWEEWLSLQPQMEAEKDFRARYDGIVRTLTDARRKEKTLRDAASTRTLLDVQRNLVITERGSPLSQKNFTREERTREGLLLRHQTYEDDVLTKETEYDPSGNAAKETLSQYFPGGQVRRVQEHAPNNGKLTLQRQTDYWRNGNTHAVLDKRSDAFAYFGEGGSLLYEDVARSNPAKRQRGMVDAKGERFGLYRDEKAKNPKLTTGQYLDMLGKKLDTEEKLAVFFEQFLWYASDDGDYWQTAEETVQRTDEYEKGGAHYMRGDCDDYAFLAREILRRQGKNAHVVYIPSHAICIWAEKDADGKYHARSQGTFGSDHNGNRYGRDYPRDREKAKGFTKLIDALNALMKKYRYPGLGLREGQDYALDENAIWIMPNPPAGTYQSVTADHFLQKVS